LDDEEVLPVLPPVPPVPPVPVPVDEVVVVVPLVLLQAAAPIMISEDTKRTIIRFGNIVKFLSVRRGGEQCMRRG
jgi:hypothetical protein